jgi:hypothetical protein
LLAAEAVGCERVCAPNSRFLAKKPGIFTVFGVVGIRRAIEPICRPRGYGRIPVKRKTGIQAPKPGKRAALPRLDKAPPGMRYAEPAAARKSGDESIAALMGNVRRAAYEKGGNLFSERVNFSIKRRAEPA